MNPDSRRFMSVKSGFRTRCPFCRAMFDADIWTFVRGDADFEIRETIMSGEFNLFMCPSCGRIFSREETFVYLDLEDGLFVFPSRCENEKDKWTAKMKEDCDAVRRSMEREDLFPGEPEIVFGVDALRDILLRETERGEESEVIKAMSEKEGFSWRLLEPRFAKKNALPAGAPFLGDFGPAGVAECCRKIYAKNKRPGPLKNLIDTLESGKEIPLNPPLSKGEV